MKYMHSYDTLFRFYFSLSIYTKRSMLWYQISILFIRISISFIVHLCTLHNAKVLFVPSVNKCYFCHSSIISYSHVYSNVKNKTVKGAVNRMKLISLKSDVILVLGSSPNALSIASLSEH